MGHDRDDDQADATDQLPPLGPQRPAPRTASGGHRAGSTDVTPAHAPDAAAPGHEPASADIGFEPTRVRASRPEAMPGAFEPTAIRASGAKRVRASADLVAPQVEPGAFEPTSISKAGPSPREPIGLERTSVRTVTSDSDPLVGAMLGEYRVLGPLGSGGMGVVYRGEQPVIGKPVAIKVLRREFASDPAHARRFLQEARLVNAARHPGIVDVFSFGETPTGEPYLVMELLEGETLDALVQRRGALPAKEAMTLLVQMLGALGAAHAAGVIHRDLKPANVFIVKLPDGTTYPKLLDFGLAKRGEVGAMVRQTSVGGTPLYIAPEQARGESIGPQTDLYSLGCVAYELLTGSPPFTAVNLHELLDAHLTLAPRPLRPQARGVPPELERLVLQMLEKDPEKRPTTAAEVREALEAALARLTAGAVPTRVSRPAATAVKAPAFVAGTSVATEAVRRPLWPFVLGGVLLVALGAGGAVVLLRGDPPSPPREGRPVPPEPTVTPPVAETPTAVEPEPTPEPEPVAPAPPVEAPPPLEPKPVVDAPKPAEPSRPLAAQHTRAQVKKRWAKLRFRAERLPDNLRRSALTELEELATCPRDPNACWADLSDFEQLYFPR